MVPANRVVASGWMEASVVVFLLCYSPGLRLPLSYCFVVDCHLLIQYFSSSHFAHVSVLLCLSITQVRIPSITEHLCSATLTTILPSIQPLATTPLAGTILLFTAYTLPYTNPVLGTTGFLLDSRTLRMGLMCCPEMSKRNYHYLLCNSPEVRKSQLLSGGSLKS